MRASGVNMRGDELREHILFVAKDVFLEMGFERASMDAIAARAETSKRTLYAHFENKESLYLAVIELVRWLFLGRLKTPAEHSDDPSKALVLFCGRFLETLLYEKTIRMCRLCVAEASRFPQGSAQYFEVVFTTSHQRLSAYLKETFRLTPKASAEAAQTILGRVIHPRFPRALFGLDELREDLSDDEGIPADFDLKPVRKVVAEWLESEEARRR
jgi:AcrR family transcriptional regulator